MRLLFDVLHPAHVHFFRYLAETVLNDGGDVLFTARRKEVTVELLDAYGLPYEVLSGIGGAPSISTSTPAMPGLGKPGREALNTMANTMMTATPPTPPTTL